MICKLCIKEGEGGASGFALEDDEVNVRDDIVTSSEVAGIAG
jgi:hypothetical protein